MVYKERAREREKARERKRKEEETRKGCESQQYSVISSDSWTTSASISHPFLKRGVSCARQPLELVTHGN